MWRVWVWKGYRVLVGKPDGRRPLGRPRRRWVDNIRMDLQEVGCGYMGWIGLAHDTDIWRTLISAVMNLRVPWNAGNFLTSCKPVSCSRRTLHRGVSKLHLAVFYYRNAVISSQSYGLFLVVQFKSHFCFHILYSAIYFSTSILILSHI